MGASPRQSRVADTRNERMQQFIPSDAGSAAVRAALATHRESIASLASHLVEALTQQGCLYNAMAAYHSQLLKAGGENDGREVVRSAQQFRVAMATLADECAKAIPARSGCASSNTASSSDDTLDNTLPSATPHALRLHLRSLEALVKELRARPPAAPAPSPPTEVAHAEIQVDMYVPPPSPPPSTKQLRAAADCAAQQVAALESHVAQLETRLKQDQLKTAELVARHHEAAVAAEQAIKRKVGCGGCECIFCVHVLDFVFGENCYFLIKKMERVERLHLQIK